MINHQFHLAMCANQQNQSAQKTKVASAKNFDTHFSNKRNVQLRLEYRRENSTYCPIETVSLSSLACLLDM